MMPDTVNCPVCEADVEWNKFIDEQLDALDKRRVRPLAENDTEYLAMLNAQVFELRSRRK